MSKKPAKKPDFYDQQKLTAYEREIAEYVDRLDLSKIKPMSRREQIRWIKMFENREKSLKKTKNINLRIKEIELKEIKSKANEVGLPYQTLISTLIRQYIQGKIHITL